MVIVGYYSKLGHAMAKIGPYMAQPGEPQDAMRVPMHAPITKPVSHATLGHPAPVNGDSNAPFFRTCGARPGYFECLLGVREDEAVALMRLFYAQENVNAPEPQKRTRRQIELGAEAAAARSESPHARKADEGKN